MTKIILVDDHKALRAGLALLLKDLGFEVIGQASNGIEFMQMLETCKPDVVLMDINMPEMNGIEATKNGIQKYPDLKILILSMFNDEQYYNELINIGAKGFIQKESDHDEVYKAITAIENGKLYFSQELLLNIIKKNNEIDRLELKPRDKEVLYWLCKGLSSPEIGEKLLIGLRTVEKIRSELLQRTKTNNSISLAMFAVKNRLIEL
jgi:DNA-binding NarL/FixJ family response regulator